MDISDIFYFFSARERGRGRPGQQGGGGVGFLLKIPAKGVGTRGGREGVCGEFGGGGGGLNIFFRGAETPTKKEPNQLKMSCFIGPHCCWMLVP